MALLLVSLVSWVAAVATYIAIIYVTTGRVFVHDTQSLAIWGGVMVVVAVPAVFLPVLLALKRRVRGLWSFAIVGALLGTAPLMLFSMFWNGGNPVAGLFSPAGIVLTAVFAAFGFTFGLGFYVSHGRPA